MSDSKVKSLNETEEICWYEHDRLLLCRPPFTVNLTSNEGHLLLALIEGVSEKEALINRVWGERGLIVSDSSYYKAIHTLRHYFSEVGLGRNALKTLPRRGVVLLVEIVIRTRAEKTNAQTPTNEIPPTEIGENNIEELPTSFVEKPITSKNAPTPAHPQLSSYTKSKVAKSPEKKPEFQIAKFKYLFLSFLGIAMPCYYSYIIYTKPQPLEDWRPLSHPTGLKFFIENEDKTPLDKINFLIQKFESPNIISETNFYVRKPASELFISCEKIQSHGEALCTNYLLINQKR